MRVLFAIIALLFATGSAIAEEPPAPPAELAVEADLDVEAALEGLDEIEILQTAVEFDPEVEAVCHACGCGADAGCCGDGCCGPIGCCGDGCCNSCCCPTWLAGVEASLIWADVDGLRGTAETRRTGVTTTTQNNFAEGDGFTATPRLWLTRVRGCWGFSVRYWNFSRGENDVNVFAPPSNNFGYIGTGNLDAFTIDLLAERYYGNACRSRTLFFGVRHADIQASQFLVQTEQDGVDNIASSLTRYRVDGTGPTFGLVGRKRLDRNPNWNRFWRVGGSVLFGDALSQSQAIAQTGTAAPVINASAGDDNSVLYIAEIQVGLERVWALQCAPMNAFFRVAGEYQYWGSDSDARSGANATTANAASTAGANDLDLQFFGVTIGTGLTW